MNTARTAARDAAEQPCREALAVGQDDLGFVRGRFKNWRRIGKLTFDSAVASYNGDHVFHFNHPGWRDDQNNPATANRAALT